MSRRFRLTQVAGSGTQNGLIITMPPPPSPAPLPTQCPSFPPLADWSDITAIFDCAGNYPAGATIAAGGVFSAAPGVDTATLYEWSIDVSAMTAPHICCLVPIDSAVLTSNFRYLYAAGQPLQVDPPDNSIVSPYFILRPGGGASQAINAYQRGDSWPGDTAPNGLLETVRFRVLCLPVAPA